MTKGISFTTGFLLGWFLTRPGLEHRAQEMETMNWRIEATSRTIASAEPHVEQAEGEDAKPSGALIAAAREAAQAIAGKLDGEKHIEVHGHETTSGKGFKPGHVTVSVSKQDPKAES